MAQQGRDFTGGLARIVAAEMAQWVRWRQMGVPMDGIRRVSLQFDSTGAYGTALVAAVVHGLSNPHVCGQDVTNFVETRRNSRGGRLYPVDNPVDSVDN
ncbi:hypothetical protein [Alicyclobacillus sp. ALC3]|uniref:hypothetical protein n=1 Tax=Alicyclobacillus sp. ALC3 TaxID=2796143 RepID=UPI0023797730|nr:hypothetical protein [Alicyclobacillus sp. ALC3]WDL95463.1 hypothetical protein JC200_13725 [Alicyclobacillus sp. ALC3]